MNREITTKILEDVKNALGTVTEKYPVISTVLETMEKHGYLCIYMSKEEQWSYLVQVAPLKRLVLTFALHTTEKNTLFSTSLDLEKLTQDFTKSSKRLRMDWYLITDTLVDVEISEVRR